MPRAAAERFTSFDLGLQGYNRDRALHFQKQLLEGVRRLVDYLDPNYALDYLRRIERIAASSAITRTAKR